MRQKNQLQNLLRYFPLSHKKLLILKSVLCKFDKVRQRLIDSFVSYWENRHKLPEGANIPAYILVSLKNECLTYLNRLRKEQEIVDHLRSQQEWELDFQISSLEACNPQEIFSEEVQQLVNKAIESLPTKTKEVFLLSRMEYLTNREISERLGVSIKAVEFHITKALKVMRIALKDYLPAFFYLFLN